MQKQEQLCKCRESIPGFIRREDGRGDRLACLLCRRPMDPQKGEVDCQPEKFAGRALNAYVDALKELGKIPSADTTLYLIEQYAHYVMYLYRLIRDNWGKVPRYVDEGNYWELKPITQEEKQEQKE